MIGHNIDVQSLFSWAPKVVRKCATKHWFSCGADGRSLGLRARVELRYKFLFLLNPEEAKYHLLKNIAPQLILTDDIPGWPTINVCRTFKNTMLTEIGKFMITPFSGEKNTMWLYFTVQFRKCKPANQKAKKGLPGKHCDIKYHLVCCV